jgi:hypothetical protein
MITFIITLIIGFIYGTYSLEINSNGDDSIGVKIFMSIIKYLIIGLLSILVWFIINFFISIFIDKKVVEAGKTYLTSMNDQNQTEGRLFLGSGVIEGVMYYTYYYKTQSGSYRFGKINSYNVDIIELDQVVPHIQYYKEEFVDKDWNKWIAPMVYNIEPDIFVPKNSIQRKIIFDLE